MTLINRTDQGHPILVIFLIGRGFPFFVRGDSGGG